MSNDPATNLQPPVSSLLSLFAHKPVVPIWEAPSEVFDGRCVRYFQFRPGGDIQREIEGVSGIRWYCTAASWPHSPGGTEIGTCGCGQQVPAHQWLAHRKTCPTKGTSA